ncbi:hypothetical protein [Manganibacter manganicus]|uniref:hypothetical protein n=1 Tax=Manganibacter manganicus TaxID=1873176 RepID=UPI001301FDE2|nr:hypothetical protein [Pseudaminobacter manganicus]
METERPAAEQEARWRILRAATEDRTRLMEVAAVVVVLAAVAVVEAAALAAAMEVMEESTVLLEEACQPPT